jgi:hypothetical protein
MSYYAIQNAVSVFNDAMECMDCKTTSKVSQPDETFVCDWQDRRTGTGLAVFWDRSGRPSDMNVTRKIELRMKSRPFANPVWVDVLTGNAYEIPADKIRECGEWTVYTVPCYDSPTFVTDRGILDLDASWFVRAGCPRDERKAPDGLRFFSKAMVYGPAEMKENTVLASEKDVSAACGDGRVQIAANGRFNLMRPGILDSEVKLGEYIVFKLWSRDVRSVSFCWRNDYYGALAVNGKIVHGNIAGPTVKWEKESIDLEKGDNEIVFRTLPGTSGEWFLEAGVIDEAEELVIE